MSGSILNSDQPNILKQSPPKDDPWGNIANNPYKLKAHMKKLNARHLAHNDIVTGLEAKLAVHLKHIATLEEALQDSYDDQLALKQDLTIAEGKVAAKAKADNKKSSKKSN